MVDEAWCAGHPEAVQIVVSHYAVHLFRTTADRAFLQSNTPSLAKKQRSLLEAEAPSRKALPLSPPFERPRQSSLLAKECDRRLAAIAVTRGQKEIFPRHGPSSSAVLGRQDA